VGWVSVDWMYLAQNGDYCEHSDNTLVAVRSWGFLG